MESHAEDVSSSRVYRALEMLMNFYHVLMKTGIYFNKNDLTRESWKYLAVHSALLLLFVCSLVSEENSEEMYEDIYKTKNNDQKPEWVSFVGLSCRLIVFPVYLVSLGLRRSPISHDHPWGKIMWSGDKLLKYYIVIGSIFISVCNHTS